MSGWLEQGTSDDEFTAEEHEAAQLFDDYIEATRGQAYRNHDTTMFAIHVLRRCPPSERRNLVDAIEGLHLFRRMNPGCKG